jgi:hypothetical protein
MGRWPRTSPGDHKGSAFLLHDLLGLFGHEDAAIEAGVHPLAPAVFRVLDDLQVLLGDIEEFDGDPQRQPLG